MFQNGSCGYWNRDADDGFGVWESEGCHKDTITENQAVCHYDKLAELSFVKVGGTPITKLNLNNLFALLLSISCAENSKRVIAQLLG